MSRGRHAARQDIGHAVVRIATMLVAAAGIAPVIGCREMADQARLEPLEASEFFADGKSARPLLPGTVARGHLRVDRAMVTGKVEGQPVARLPVAVTATVMQRGKERYNIFCAHCHDRVGNGQGMVVRRGFPRPPSYHIRRLREAPPGHLFDVITNGLGRMPSLSPQIPPEDRWAIVAYVRALQFSQYAPRQRLKPADLQQLSQPATADGRTEEVTER